MITHTTCPSSGIQSHRNITIPCVGRGGHVKHTLSPEDKASAAILSFISVLGKDVWTYCEDGDEARRPLAQQLIQLLFGERVNNETEDEEDGEDEAQSPAQEGVETDAFVVAHVGPERNLVLISGSGCRR